MSERRRRGDNCQKRRRMPQSTRRLRRSSQSMGISFRTVAGALGAYQGKKLPRDFEKA